MPLSGTDQERADQLLSLAERDYRFGAGSLNLRVLAVDRSHPVLYDGEEWVTVHGVEISRTGKDLARRILLVRAARLALRRTR